MQSSRTRTARFKGHLYRGGVCLGVVCLGCVFGGLGCLPSQVYTPWTQRQTLPPPPCEQNE